MPTRKWSTPEGTAELNHRREDAFRPNRFLGYNHNRLAVHLLEREAYPIAESELRRAVWLNPFEPAFKANLAWCLHKRGHDNEARDYLKQAVEQGPDSGQVRQVADLLGPILEAEKMTENDESED